MLSAFKFLRGYWDHQVPFDVSNKPVVEPQQEEAADQEAVAEPPAAPPSESTSSHAKPPAAKAKPPRKPAGLPPKGKGVKQPTAPWEEASEDSEIEQVDPETGKPIKKRKRTGMDAFLKKADKANR